MPHITALFVFGRIGFVAHHTLVKQRIKRLDAARGQVAGFDHRTGEKAGIKQMQNRVFYPTDILVDVHPVIGIGQVGGRVGIGRGKTGVIP